MKTIQLMFMKTTQLMRYVLYAAFLVVFGLVGCESMDIYDINAPDDLQDRIDSIADANASGNTGDTTYLTIATAIVGPEDCSAAWWTSFSDYFNVPANKRLHLEFVNHNNGSENNWNNWNLAVANVDDRDADDYAEYFVLRSDSYGWGNDDYDGNMITNDYPDTDGDDDIWNDFRATMDGAYVTIEVDHSVTGNVFVTAVAEGTNGTVLTQTYQQPVSAAEVSAFLICDASYFEMEEAYLVPSEVTVVEDVDPVSIAIEGAPALVELGNPDFWGNAVATVTFADGSSTQVDTADLSFSVIPDMTTLGEKTVIVAYSKTKQGEYCKAVSNMYNFNLVMPVASLAITESPIIDTYYYYDDTLDVVFNSTGLVVTATYDDGTSGVIDNSSLHFSTIPAAAGPQVAVISYYGAEDTVTTSCPITLVKGVTQVGASDFSTAWWTEFSDDYTVASGDSTKLTMYCYSNGVNSWHSPCVILRKADATEFGVVRMDNFGWGDGYASATLTNDWDFDVFAANISGSKIVVTVTNNADDTADIRYDVTYANGDTHFQLYEGIAVESADLNCALVIEGAYVVIVE